MFATHFSPPAADWPGRLVTRSLYGLLMLSALSALSACGDAEGPARMAVRGTVSLNGEILPAGVIRFIPIGAAQGPAASATIEAGKYKLSEADGPVVGQHRVEIEATNYTGFAIDDGAAFAVKVRRTGGRLPRNPVPASYNRQSTLQVEISPSGPNEFDFGLSTATERSPAK